MLCVYESNQQSHLTANSASSIYVQSESVTCCSNLSSHCPHNKGTNCVPRNWCREHTNCRKYYRSLSCKLPVNSCGEDVSDILPNIKEDNLEQSSLAVVEYSQQVLSNTRKNPNCVMSTWHQGKLLSSLRQSLFGPHHANVTKPKIIFGGTYPIDQPLSFRSKPVSTFTVDAPIKKVQNSSEIVS